MNFELLQTIINNYSVGTVISFEKIVKGLSSANYKVVTEQGEYFLKQHRASGGQRLSSIEQAERFFSSHDIPVISPIATLSGQYHVVLKDTYYVLYPFVFGIQHESGNIPSGVARVMGAMLAQAHLLSKDGFVGEYAEDKSFRLYPTEKILSEIEELLLLAVGDTEYDKIAQEGLLLKKDLVEKNKLTNESFDLHDRHLCFGDYYPDNIFFDDQGNITHIFDLDMAGPMPRMFELVRSMFLSCFWYSFNKQKIESAKVFVNAYHEVYPFQKEEFQNALELYYVKSCQSLWRERAHYKEQDFRSDASYKDDVETIEYFSKNRENLCKKVLQDII